MVERENGEKKSEVSGNIRKKSRVEGRKEKSRVHGKREN